MIECPTVARISLHEFCGVWEFGSLGVWEFWSLWGVFDKGVRKNEQKREIGDGGETRKMA
jgi:hypothetical protein